MDESKAIEYLMHFGMSRQEATVYLRLIEAGKQTGYEIARDTGISRSNVYASLAALVEKGAAYLVEEDAKRYIPVHVQEFCGNRIRRMEEEQKWLDMNLTGEQKEEEGYVRSMVRNIFQIRSIIFWLMWKKECIVPVPVSVWNS